MVESKRHGPVSCSFHRNITALIFSSPPTIVIRTLCFRHTSMSIGFQADSSTVGLNESIGLTAVARNDSSAEVKELHVEIKQVSTWYARGYKDVRTRTIASVVVPGTQLRPAEVGNQRGRSDAAIADTARADLQEQLSAGAGSRYELLVPGNSLLTLQTDMIQVRHTLNVVLKTPHCISSPDVWTPLVIHAGTTSSSEAVPGYGSFEPHNGKPVPFATGLDTDGSVRPVSVPQSAVTLTYKNELSQY